MLVERELKHGILTEGEAIEKMIEPLGTMSDHWNDGGSQKKNKSFKVYLVSCKNNKFTSFSGQRFAKKSIFVMFRLICKNHQSRPSIQVYQLT